MYLRNRSMFNKVKKITIATFVLLLVTVALLVIAIFSDEKTNNVVAHAPSTSTDIYESIEPVTLEKVNEPEEPTVSEEEINLIALVTMAEAEGECEEGKRLVIDTILNRVDSIYWPDTITEVIYQPHQFTSMWNGRVERCYVMEEICQLVREELVSRTNYDVVFFTANEYGRYGQPMFQVGNHYFSSYD